MRGPRGAGEHAAPPPGRTPRARAAGSPPRTPRAGSRRNSRGGRARRRLEQREHQRLLALERRHLQHRAPSAGRRQERHRRASATASRAAPLRFLADPLANLGRAPRRPRSRLGRASCDGVDTERNVSATISRPFSASSTAASAALTCRSTPPSPAAARRTSRGRPGRTPGPATAAAPTRRRPPSQAVVGEHLVADERQVPRGGEAGQRLELRGAHDRAGGVVRATRPAPPASRVERRAMPSTSSRQPPCSVEVVRYGTARDRAPSGARTADSSAAAPAPRRRDRRAA